MAQGTEGKPQPHVGPVYDSTGRLMASVASVVAHAEYVPGIGWMAVTRRGRSGSYETEAAAKRAAILEAAGAPR